METRTKLIKVATFYFIESVGIIERSKELGVKESDLIVVASEIAVLVSKTIDEGVDEDVISEVPLELDENNEDEFDALWQVVSLAPTWEGKAKRLRPTPLPPLPAFSPPRKGPTF